RPVRGRRRRRLRAHPRFPDGAGRLQLREQSEPGGDLQPGHPGAVRAPRDRRRRHQAGPALGAGRGLRVRAREEGDLHEPAAAVRPERHRAALGLLGRSHRGLPLLSTAVAPMAPPARGKSAARLRYYLIWTYLLGSAAAGPGVTFLLIGLGLEFAFQQWIHFLILASVVIPCYTLPDVWLIARHVRPITSVLAMLARGERPDPQAVSRAIVRALDLP